MAYPHNLRAPTNARSPALTGICRRCGFLWHLSRLDTQFEWRGPALAATLGRVCPKCLDFPNEQLRTIVIGPDGIGPQDPSPTFYAQQNASPGFDPGLAPLMDDSDEIQLLDDDGNPLLAG